MASTNPTPMRRGPKGPSAPETTLQQGQAPETAIAAEDLNQQVGAVAEADAPAAAAAEALDLGMEAAEAAAPEAGAPEAPEAEAKPHVASTTVLTGKDRAAWVADVVTEAVGKPFNAREAENSAYHNVIKVKGLKDSGMREAVTVGTLAAFARLGEVNRVPEGRTIEADLESLGRSIERRTKAINGAVERSKPEFKEKNARGAQYELDALKVIADAGQLAAQQGNQKAVRGLNAILVGQSNVNFAAMELRKQAADQKENYPVFKPAAVNNGIQGIKDPARLVEVVTKWFTYEVKDEHTKQQSWENAAPSATKADARARAAKAAHLTHMFAVPQDFTAQQEFLKALGKGKKEEPAAVYERKTGAVELNERQKAAVAELKAIVADNAAKLPAEPTEAFRAMCASGVEVTGKDGVKEVFSIGEADNQALLHSHMAALNGQDAAKAAAAEIYFGRMWKSGELAAAILEQ